MNKRRMFLIFFCICLAITTAAWAETEAETPPEKIDTASSDEAKETLDEMVVTAARMQEDPFRAARSLSILDQQDLDEAAPRTTPEALWDSTGVFVQETNFGGGSPILRGLIGPQVLILVDGVRLNNSTYRTGPVQYLNLIDPFAISRIEVLRGPGSVLYGSDAMGGVIQVFTQKPRQWKDPDRIGGGGNLTGRYSSADRGATGHAHADFGYGGMGILAGGTYRTSDDLTGGRGVGEQVFTGYDNYSANGSLGFVFPMWSVQCGYLLTQITDAGRTDKLYDKNSLQYYDNTDHLAYLKATGNISPLRTELALTVSYQDFFERKDNYTVANDYKTRLSVTRDDVAVATLGGDLQFTTRLFNNRLALKFGGMWYRDDVEADREAKVEIGSSWEETGNKPYPDGSTYDNYGAFVLFEGDPLFTKSGHVVRIGAGYRFHGMRGVAPEEGDLPEVDFTETGHVYNASVRYMYKTFTTIAVNFSQGFRAPNLQEAVQLGDTGKYFHIPNDDLEPETTDTFELIARMKIMGIEVSASGYMSFLNNLIRREETTWRDLDEIDGKQVVENINGGDGMIWGVESQLKVDLILGFSVAGNVTYTFGEEDKPGGDTDPLSRIPPLFGMAKLRYDTQDTNRWNGFAEVYCRGAVEQDRLSDEDVKDVRIPEGGTPEWMTWNVRTGAVFFDKVRLGVSVENLTNAKYKYHGSGVYAPGTNAQVTAELFF